MVHEARLLLDETTAGKNGEVGNAPHVEAGSQFREAFRIYLEHNCSRIHLCSSARHFRSCHPARTTPGSPEIDQHRNACFLDNLVEQLRICFQWLSTRWQRCFASSAPSGICEMLGGNAVLSTAYLAASKDGHEGLQTIVPLSSRRTLIDLQVSSSFLKAYLPGVQ